MSSHLKLRDKVMYFRGETLSFQGGYRLKEFLPPPTERCDYPVEKAIISRMGKKKEVYLADLYKDLK